MKYFIVETKWLTHVETGWGNGYVAIPKSSTWHGAHHDSIPVNVHGGLTLSELAKDFEGKPSNISDDDWIIGFDTAHAYDNAETWNKDAVEAEAKRLLEKMQGLDKIGFAKLQKSVKCPHCGHMKVLTDVNEYYIEAVKATCENCRFEFYHQTMK